MKIKELYFRNKAHRWELERTGFSDLTLLVGASGVGKTRILDSIVKLVNISYGYAYNGIEWDLKFVTDDNKGYRWLGEFESIKGLSQQIFKEEDISGNKSVKKIPRLISEKLYLEDELIFERTESSIKYERKDVPKVTPYISVLNLFSEEDKIVPVKSAFRKIVSMNYYSEKHNTIKAEAVSSNCQLITMLVSSMDKYKAEKKSDREYIKKDSYTVLKGTKIAIMLKLVITWFEFREKFDEIVQDFRDIFPQVEEVRFKEFNQDEIYELQIKERGTDWISRSEISDGMFKTLLHLAEMKLMSEGFVILIDEFENSLGVNCIDIVANDLVNPERNLQYIITSHHPYIINNIDMKYWKVVMRKGAKVFTKNADQLKLGKSKHEAFKQLLNLEEFSEGIS